MSRSSGTMRPALLTGTALVSTLFAAGLMVSAPAHAVTVTIDETDVTVIPDNVVNASKLNTTLLAGFSNVGVAHGLADAIALANGAAVLSSYSQIGNIFFESGLEGRVTVKNTGDIDPLVGIGATIDNLFIASGNFTAIALANGAQIAGDLTQQANVDASNRLVNTIDVDNDGNLTASLVGTVAGVSNVGVAMGNASFTAIAAGVNVLGRIVQEANVGQGNIVGNDVSIVNRGDVIAPLGLTSAALNAGIALGNVSFAAIASGADVLTRTSQSIDIDQGNTIASSIFTNNSGDTNGSLNGIGSVIGVYGAFLGNASFNAIANGIDIVGDLNQASEISQTNLVASGIGIVNRGDLTAKGIGIFADIDTGGLLLDNAAFSATANGFDIAGNLAQGLAVNQANVVENNISIQNFGKVGGGAYGIAAGIYNGDLLLQNFARGVAVSADDVVQAVTFGQTNKLTNNILIVNNGEIGGDVAIGAVIESGFIELDNDLAFIGSASASASTLTVNQSNLVQNQITVLNSGRVNGSTVGIVATIVDPIVTQENDADPFVNAPNVNISQQFAVSSAIQILNTGSITADSLFAIDTNGASTTIRNFGGGVITGFVDLTERADRFFNQSGGTFEARRESDFGGGNDLFRNSAGGIVHTADNRNSAETTGFVNLERFENQGLISLQDFRQGDVFEISNTPGQNNLVFNAGPGSTLAVDAFLGPPGSTADNFIINGDVTGRTELKVLNTNPHGGALNRVGIPVVFANGHVSSNAFYLEKPIDAGFFDFDLFFVPTGSGFFELRSHPGGGAHILPHVVTATHDVFQLTAETWFDQSSDLRLLLASGACATRNRADMQGRCEQNVTPAAWARGSAGWFNLEDKATTTSSGRTYHYDLERDLDIMNFESGFDFGKQDLLAQGDLLIFGVLGGFVHAELDYDNLARKLDMSGGEAGAYATYLRGGFFFDTLFKAVFLEHDFREGIGFPDDFGGNVYGLRSDTGYRFGGFRNGPFIEPLATIAVSWTDLEDFAIGGNRVDFKDDENVRGRLGLRLGTSMQATETVLMEPFIVGSLWGTLSGSHSASLTSAGETFTFTDEPEDVWGVVSAGANFFNLAGNTAVFAKVDLTFGDELDGVGGKAGMRVAW